MRAPPRPSGGSGSSRRTVACPSPTPATSSTELVGPVGSVPMPGSRGLVRAAWRHPARQRAAEAEWACWRRDPHPRRLVARRPGGTTPGTRSGSASPPPGTEVPARVDAILAAMAAHRPLAAHRTTTRCSTGARRGLLAFLAARRTRPGWPGPTPRWSARTGWCPTSSPPPRSGGMDAAAPAGRPARPGRAVLLRHDDPGRAGHLGGRPGRGRRRAHRGRPGRRRGAGGVRPVPAAGPPRRPERVRRLLLPQQRGRRRRGAARRRARAGRRPRRRRPPRQRHPGDLLGARRRALRLAARRPGGRLVPPRVRLRRRDAAPARATGATRNVPLPEGTGDDAWVEAVGRPRLAGSVGGLHRPGGLARGRRGRRRPGEPAAGDPRRASAPPGGSLGGPGCPTVLVQEGGYHLPTMGGLVAAFLAGHAAP